jgi:SWI/SNF-related matrix-associated actin-dependent regulator of chromatin subfamily A-like protein 1
VLYDHQVTGAQWLAARHRGLLGDVPGLGKTRTILAGLNGPVDKTLIVCPAIVRTHWRREASHLGYDGQSAGAPQVKSYDEIVHGGVGLLREYVQRQKIDTLVLDEVHFCKHAASKRTQLLLGRDGYAPRMARVYAASGTPVPKNAYEFGTILLSLFPEVAVAHGLRTLADVKARFCLTRGSYVRGAWREKILADVQHPEEFREILSAVMLRRTLDDVGLDVPALDWQTTRLDGEAPDAFTKGALFAPTQYRGALADLANEPAIARARRRLGELKVGPTLALLRAQLDESDEKIVVFAHHRNVLRELSIGLASYGSVYIDGDTSPATRDRAIEHFQHDPNIRVFVGQNIACQTGITLTAARRVYLVEPDWTAVVNAQLGHRVARIGQTADHCIAHMICLADTLDEAIVGQNLKEVRMAGTIGLGGG